MNLKEILLKGVAFLADRDAKREEGRRAAGIILAHDAEIRRNLRNQIRANHEAAVRDIIKATGVVSDCCGSACLSMYDGSTACAGCLDKCKTVRVKEATSTYGCC
jgi:hypothetical protein